LLEFARMVGGVSVSASLFVCDKLVPVLFAF
jgi:hypothetical protein